MTARLKSYWFAPLAMFLAYLLLKHEANDDFEKVLTLSEALTRLKGLTTDQFADIFGKGDPAVQLMSGDIKIEALVEQLEAIIRIKDDADAIDDLTSEEELDEVVWPGISNIDEDDQGRVRALCLHLDCDPDDLTEAGDNRFRQGKNHTYLVLTDSEADDAWDKALDIFMDECVLTELPEQYRYYFDRERWKNDAKVDGRGHSLSSYDGNENDETDPVTDTTYYIFRQ